MTTPHLDQIWERTVTGLKAQAGAPMVFGGPVRAGGLELRYFSGARTSALRDLSVARGAGLGGKVWRERRPAEVDEYSAATSITHHYDEPVGREGLRALVAVPVLQGGQVRGVLYAGSREAGACGDRLRSLTWGMARRLSADLATEAEIERRLAARMAESAALRERIRRIHAELRVLKGEAKDPALRRKLAALAEGVTDLARPAEGHEQTALTPRERDILALVAEGLSYRYVGVRLGLAQQTVKSYMRDIIARLGVHSRHEAVVEARRQGILP